MTVLTTLGILLLVVVGIIAGYFLFMLIGYFVPVNRKYEIVAGGVDIYLHSNGMHTDFILPTEHPLFDWKKIIPEKPFDQSLSDTPYIGVGWGDKAFYLDLETWDQLTFKMAAVSLLVPTTPTLMHITAYEQLPYEAKKLTKISISKAQYVKLCSYVLDSFDFDEKQNVQLIPDVGYAENDNFYHAHGSYHALYTCNYWVNHGLKKIGVRTSLWTPTDRGIFYQIGKVSSLLPEDNLLMGAG
ncbi:MAG: TIGR02117 family protein [Bacteroidota bacterium]